MLVPPSPAFAVVELDTKVLPNEEHVNTVQFLQRVCRRLRFPIRTLSTACSFYHLYYQHNNNNSNNGANPSDIALTAILLAAKTEETYKRIREILQAALVVSNPEFEGKQVDIHEETREAVVKLEETLLECIGFKFNTRLCLFKQLVLIGSVKLRNGRETMRKAWESLVYLHCYPVVISFPGAYLAIACILHARVSMKKDTKKEYDYVEETGMEKHIVESIIGLYFNRKTGAVTQ